MSVLYLKRTETLCVTDGKQAVKTQEHSDFFVKHDTLTSEQGCRGGGGRQKVVKLSLTTVRSRFDYQQGQIFLCRFQITSRRVTTQKTEEFIFTVLMTVIKNFLVICGTVNCV
jgi:hypothetical protein